MSARNQNYQYENHHLAAELHDAAAHAHRAAELHRNGEHLTGHERSRKALEHSQEAHEFTQALTLGYGVAGFTHDETVAIAHEFWVARGCPIGSPETDWYRATEQLQSRARAT